MVAAFDPAPLAQALIRCPSVTPADAGALGCLQEVLEDLGFSCERMPFSEEGQDDVDNLLASIGQGAPHFCFAGHTDVVPVGNLANWSVEPFEGVIQNGQLVGRGACDMKGSIAAFVCAVSSFLHDSTDNFAGTISFLITGDEEGPAVNGTAKMLTQLRDKGVQFDHVLVGEPSCQKTLGDMIKIGRRGSLNARVTARGAQGHVAYPHLADNPIPRLIELLRRLSAHVLDEGNVHFQPSNLEIVTVDTGNQATNVIPAEVHAGFNIRFNNLHTEASLIRWIEREIAAVENEMGGHFELQAKASGEAFLTTPCGFTDLMQSAIREVTELTPVLSTSGGTSDARFISQYSPVIEFGLVGQTMHKADEHVSLQDLAVLRDIYRRLLDGYFSRDGGS
ncbi:MAG: succinyl-diaminopimelate desuccinylase [Alphaproteobacteria bacterium]|nr:MAG: succinyl-diaminopimelate desuccinylase [Alphaproteobacteria bacterium]